MPYPDRRRGGGGAGGRQTVNAGDFADLAALNTWGAANLSLLNNSETTVTIASIGSDVYEWTGEDMPSSYPAGGSWTAMSIAGPSGPTGPEGPQGPQGIPGSGTDFSAISDNHVPVIGPGPAKLPRDSGIEILADGTVLIPANTLGIGELIELSEATGFGLIHNNVTDAAFVLIDGRLDQSAGSSRPRQFFISPPSVQQIQPDNATQITTNPLSVPYTATISGSTFWLELQTFAAMANVKFRLLDANTGVAFKYAPSRLAWDDDNLPGYSFRSGTNRLNMFSGATDDPANGMFNLGFSPLVLESGRALTIEVKADNMALLGNSANVPAFSGLIGTGEFRDMAYLSDVGGPPVTTPQPRVASFALTNVPNTVADGFVIPGEHVFTWSIERPELVQGNVTISRDGVDLVQAPASAGTASIPLTDRTLNFGDSVTYAISGTSTTNQAFSRMYTVRVPQQHEFGYWGIRNANDFATVDVAFLNSVDLTENNEFDVTGSFADQAWIGILMPSDMDATAIRTLGTNVLSSFTRTENVRTIGSRQYILYTLQNTGGIAGEAAYTVEK